MKGLFTTKTAALKATIIDSSKIEAKKIILDGQNLKDSLDNLEQIITELEIKRPKISNVSFKFGEIKNGSIEKLSFVDGEIVANVDAKFHLIQMTIDGERISSPILKTENGWVVRVHEVDASEEDISFLYPTLTDDSEFSLLFVSSGDDIDAEGGEGGGLCGCEPFELTAEAVQAVVPMAFGAWTEAPYQDGNTGNVAIGDAAESYRNAVALGYKAKAYNQAVAIGSNTKTGQCGVAIGLGAQGEFNYGTTIGHGAQGNGACSVSLGYYAGAINPDAGNAITIGTLAKGASANAITLGPSFTETTDKGNVTHTCTTEGTGSITIGAGANTLNTTTADGSVTESSNAVTIGCKAENKGADSVVIGAQAKVSGAGGVAIGAKAQAEMQNDIAIGNNSHSKGNTTLAAGVGATVEAHCGTALGAYSSALSQDSLSVGREAQVERNSPWSTAIGYHARVSDQGVVVLATRSGISDNKKTQIYFAGAGTDLANQYYNGEAFMGYVVTDQASMGGVNVLACGTRRLSELFPDNSLTQPAKLDENGEWVMPKVFHPSDLDLPVEEPIEPEEYQPLPVYPIVEPEIEEYIQE